ncbi:hypothetical protein LWI28_023696 [Acer negundo]|uniref:Uncharacterized protein n=1 Tax=Acer negundo TaxID=4023 RepID=A0AAD5J2P0_ACENE|nr:hypothetical protein LWI28_023696 [Acer negundo]
MDSRVEKLEADVNSLTIGQQQILDKLNELSIQFNTRASIQPTNCPPDLEGENSQAPLQSPNRRMGGTNGTSQQGSHYAPRFVKLDFPRFKGEEDITSCEVLAKKVGLQPVQGGQFEVMVASGERLSSQGKCKCVTLLLQGIPVSVDFYLLPLEGYDIVLGTQWLRTLGPIWWDFAKLQMKFKVAEADVILQGESCPADQIVGELKFIKEARKGYKGMLFQLFSLDSPRLSQEEQYQSSHLQQLLEKFRDVFDEPNSLPPSRTHDHKVPLIPGSGPVCVKPYRYPYYQKSEIERLVAEMLSTDKAI